VTPAPATWVCPGCSGQVHAEGATERDPLRCEDCSARYRHPRLALLLSLVLPGLGSLYQRRWLWGGLVLVAGTGAFVWTVWRLAVHLLAAWEGTVRFTAMLGDSALGIALVMLSYGVDVLVVWLLRNRLHEY
jgi:hypothetical protein